MADRNRADCDQADHDGADRHDLACLGVSLEEEAVYRTLLREPGARSLELAAAAGVSTDVDAVLGRLRALGMVGSDTRGWVAVDPNIVVDRLMDLRLDAIQSQLQQILSARHLVNRLCQDQRRVRAGSASVDVERIEGLERARSVIEELSFFTHREMLSIQPGTLSAAAIEATRASDLRCLRRGISVRTVVRAESLRDGPTAAYLAELAGAGMEVRVADGPLDRVLIFDRCAGVVPIDPGGSARGVMVIKESGLVSGIVTMFERVWSAAAPHGFGNASGQERPTEPELQVLRALARGDKDEVGARGMGISVRSFRSHVASVIQRLGAESRFQAALLARERGWL